MQNKRIKKLLQALSILLTAAVAYFAFLYAKSLLADAREADIHINGWLLACSTIFLAGYYLVASWHWLLVCRQVEGEADRKQFLAYLASQPYKYLPTSAFSFSYRAKFAKDLGLSLKRSSFAQLIENGDIVISGTLVSLLGYLMHESIYIGVSVIFAAIIIIGYFVRKEIKIKLPYTQRTMHINQLLPKMTVMALAWCLSGVAFWFIGQALGFDQGLWLMISASSAASIAGILAVFAPGGIGVRELVLSVFSIGAPIIIIWRIMTFVADLLLGFTAVAYIKLRK